jgi:hypothetical protein
MDWRTILKFDENLYEHTDEESKEKHRRILDFINNRPKTKKLGQKIQDFLSSGELDETEAILDLPRNPVTSKTREFYNNETEFPFDPDGGLGSLRRPKTNFELVKQTVNRIIDTIITGVINRDFRGEERKTYAEGVRKLVRYFYYVSIPENDNFFDEDEPPYYKGIVFNQALNGLLSKYDNQSEFDNNIIDIVYPFLEKFYPTRQEINRYLMDSFDFRRRRR